MLKSECADITPTLPKYIHLAQCLVCFFMFPSSMSTHFLLLLLLMFYYYYYYYFVNYRVEYSLFYIYLSYFKF